MNDPGGSGAGAAGGLCMWNGAEHAGVDTVYEELFLTHTSFAILIKQVHSGGHLQLQAPRDYTARLAVIPRLGLCVRTLNATGQSRVMLSPR